MPVKPDDPKGSGGGNPLMAKIRRGFNFDFNRFMPILLLVYVVAVIFYMFFMVEKTVFRDIYFFSIQWLVTFALCMALMQREVLKPRKHVYLFGGLFNLIYLLFILCILLIDGVNDFFDNMDSDNLGFVLGFMMFITFIVIWSINLLKKRE